VSHVDELELERPELDARSRIENLQRGVPDPMLLELGANEPDGERAAVDHGRHPDLAKDERQGADVVLVAVRHDHGLDVVDAAAQI
jgi:hypothetical protein